MPEISIEQGAVTDEGYLPITISTRCGRIECRYYRSENARSTALFVGGIGGNFDTPAKGLYPRLCQELIFEKISSLRVSFRHPTDLVKTVVTLATQGYGADAVSRFRPDTSILIIHGKKDTVLTPRCSSAVYDMAHEPKQIKLYEGAGHGLDEAAEEVHGEVLSWILRWLK